MTKKILGLFITLFTFHSVYSQTLTIDFNPKNICPGTTLTITTTQTGVFGAGNTFNVIMSDASGNFGSTTNFGSQNGTVMDTFIAELPKNIPTGSGYLIRINSTNPALSFTSVATLNIYPKPNPSYTFTNDSQCYSRNFYNFTSNSTISSGTIDSFYWNWQDGSTDSTTLTTASHKFRTFFFSFYPKLTVISNLGCTDSFSRQVNLKESVRISTEINDDIQCLKGNSFGFKSTSEVYAGSITFKSWYFGDNTSIHSGIDSIGHSYLNHGIYQVRQINHHSNGCIDTGYTGTLVNEHPQASFTTNDTSQCIKGNYFIFQSTSTINNGLPLINYWNLTGGDLRNQVDSAHKIFNTSGTKIIQLITLSDDADDACSDTAYQEVFSNPMPISQILKLDPNLCLNGNLYRFKSTSTISSGTLTSDWDFGDMNTQSGADSVAHSYTNDGNFTVQLKSTSNRGCLDSITTSIIVRPSPIADFTLNDDTICFKNNALKAKSLTTISSGTYTRLWKFSDNGSYFDVDSILHQFGNHGNFTLKLIINSNFNCKDSITRDITILPMPTLDLTVNNPDQCFRGNLFQFEDISTNNFGTITGNKWNFGDGTLDSNKLIVSHSYLVDDVYPVSLSISAENGCRDTLNFDVTVYPHPATDFTINDSTQCVNNNNFTFISGTSITVGTFSNKWIFGDGNIQSVSHPVYNASKKYNKDTIFRVTLVSYSDFGCTDTARKNVIVHPKPRTSFTIDNDLQCRVGNLFTYTSTSTIKYGTVSLNWQFGNGNVAGNFSPVSQNYANSQFYNVRLITSSDNNCLDTTTRQIRVLPMPTADFILNYDKSCLLGNDFQFSQASTIGSGLTLNHKWFFGDGDSLVNATDAQKTYSTPNTYTVQLISNSNIGNCSDTIEKDVNVFPMPVSGFTIDDNQQCFKDHNFNFTSTSTVATGTINFTNWKFGDNTTSAMPDPSKTYSRADSFRVSLTVITDNGCLDSSFQKVYIYEMPVANFNLTPKLSCLKNNSIRFTNSSAISKGSITQNIFYFGNGDSSILRNPPNYSYSTAGDYQVILKNISDRGCEDTISKMVSIKPNPNIDFTIDPVCLKDSSVFVNNSTITTGSIVSWKWIFGNGRTSNLFSPKHKYKDVKNYDIKLIATTDQGCFDTLSKIGAAVVNPNPVSMFSFDRIRSWENEVDVQYNDLSTGAIAWNWNFASMGTSADQNPLLFYNDTLSQRTSLIVTNIFGCKDTSVQDLFIMPDVIYYVPTAFSPNDDNINETFKPVGLAFALEYRFIVFNRWGEIMYDTKDPKLGWDGKFQGKVVEQGLYFYRMEFIGADELRKEEKGNILVVY